MWLSHDQIDHGGQHTCIHTHSEEELHSQVTNTLEDTWTDARVLEGCITWKVQAAWQAHLINHMSQWKTHRRASKTPTSGLYVQPHALQHTMLHFSHTASHTCVSVALYVVHKRYDIVHLVTQHDPNVCIPNWESEQVLGHNRQLFSACMH